MGYYYKDNYETVLNVNNSEVKGNYLCNGVTIEIVNNESIRFNFKDFIQNGDIGYLSCEKDENGLFELEKDNSNILLENIYFSVPDCLYKISIDYKDGYKEVLSKTIRGNDKSWLSTEHEFNFKEFIEDEIDIHLYNLYGFETNLKLKFKVKQVSLQNQGIELGLVNANLDNNKNVSYIFNNLSENQLILAKRNALK